MVEICCWHVSIEWRSWNKILEYSIKYNRIKVWGYWSFRISMCVCMYATTTIIMDASVTLSMNIYQLVKYSTMILWKCCLIIIWNWNDVIWKHIFVSWAYDYYRKLIDCRRYQQAWYIDPDPNHDSIIDRTLSQFQFQLPPLITISLSYKILQANQFNVIFWKYEN